MADCSKTGVAKFCNNRDVRPVQLRSQATGPAGANKYEGALVLMCTECRKSNRGGFKMAAPGACGVAPNEGAKHG